MPDSVQVDLWRQKALAGTLTDEECREVVAHLRADRIAADMRGKAKRDLRGPAKTGDELLDELESL